MRLTLIQHFDTAIVDLITKTATKSLQEGSIYSLDTVGKGMIHTPGGTDEFGWRF